MNTVMQINPHDPRYFADSNGKTFIPVGCNLCFVRGAVEANHIRFSDLYAVDTQGILLHDILFAPFLRAALDAVSRGIGIISTLRNIISGIISDGSPEQFPGSIRRKRIFACSIPNRIICGSTV